MINYVPTYLKYIRINPVNGEVTSPFGYRTNPILGVLEFHDGIDIAVMEGTPVVSVIAGVVTEIRYSNTFGNLIRINSETNGYEIMYAHLNEIIVSVGDVVEKGQKVATSGNTGLSTGPHLHYTVLYNGELRDPIYYFERDFSYD